MPLNQPITLPNIPASESSLSPAPPGPRVLVFPETYTIRIIGVYPLSHDFNERKFKIAFERFSVSADVITIEAREPCLFLDGERSCSIFQFLHDLIDTTKFKNPVIFKSIDVHTATCYEKWCNLLNKEKRITIENNSLFHHITRSVKGGYSLVEQVTKEKTMSLLIGNLRFQKSHVLKWYLNNINSTDYERKILSSFMIKGKHGLRLSRGECPSVPPDLIHFKEQIARLPGKFSDNYQTRSLKVLWNSNYPKDTFNTQFSRSLFNFCVDYVEFEDFEDYDTYQAFKQQHPWWHEDMISEKTFMCILFKQPFIRLGMPHSLKILKDWGFRTYDGILFDESYDTIENFYDRSEHIFSQVMSYLQQPFESVHEKVYSPQVQEVVEHNYNLALDIINSDKYI